MVLIGPDISTRKRRGESRRRRRISCITIHSALGNGSGTRDGIERAACHLGEGRNVGEVIFKLLTDTSSKSEWVSPSRLLLSSRQASGFSLTS